MGKRLAVQLYGHLRSFRFTAEYFKRHLLLANRDDGWEVDVFIHAWDEVAHSTKKPVDDDDIAFIKKMYEPKALAITPQVALTDGEKIAVTDKNNGINYNNGKNFGFSLKSGNELRHKYQRENDVAYDYVLITRPDICFLQSFRLDVFLDSFKEHSMFFTKSKSFVFGHHFLDDYDLECQKVFDAYISRSIFVAQSFSNIFAPFFAYTSDVLYFAVPSVIDTNAGIADKLFKSIFSLNENAFHLHWAENGLAKVTLNFFEHKSWVIARNDDKKSHAHYAQYFVEGKRLMKRNLATGQSEVFFPTSRRFIKLLRQAASCLIPFRGLRHKIRGQDRIP